MLKNFEVYKSVVKQFKKTASKEEKADGTSPKKDAGKEVSFRTMPENKKIFKAQDDNFDAFVS